MNRWYPFIESAGVISSGILIGLLAWKLTGSMETGAVTGALVAAFTRLSIHGDIL